MINLFRIRPLAAATAINALLAWTQAAAASDTQLSVNVADNWGSGFTANASFTNTTGSALSGWSLTFDAPFTISSIWNAQILSHDGSTYVIGNASWNGAVAAGGSVEFGFSGAGTASSSLTATLSGEAGTGSGSGNSNTGGNGSGSGSSIVFPLVDADGTALQVTIAQGANSIALETAGSYVVATNNPDVLEPGLSGQAVTLKGLAAGRASLRIENVDTGDVRYLGVRVLNADGSVPGMPEYLAIGSVSEDSTADLDFWKDFENPDQNKRVDVRYIYLNGGATNSIGSGWNWRSDGADGSRATGYVEESVKLGMIPFFVWYNIPDGGESYYTDKQHIESASYLEGYFTDLKYALEITKEVAGDDVIGWVLEPDFLGYFAQNNTASPDEIYAATSSAYTAGVLDAATDPVFPDTLRGLVEAINYTFQKYQPNAYFGWQFNLWASPAGGWTTPVGAKGVVRLTDSLGLADGRQAVYNEASAISDYYVDAGVLTHGASFVSIDKYGLDAGYEGKSADPSASTWFWNATHWTNYLIFVNAMHDTTGLPVVLWQLPVGHINTTQAVNPYSVDGSFEPLANNSRHYEDSTGPYFLGDSFVPGSATRLAYFGAEDDGTSEVTVSGDTVTWGSHLALAKDAGVVVALFGAGVGDSTDGVGSPPTDDYWFISKVQSYYDNPVSLAGGAAGIDLPSGSGSGDNGSGSGNSGTGGNGSGTGSGTGSADIVVAYAVGSDWGSGFIANVSLTNNGTASVSAWTLSFDLPVTISGFWSATGGTRSGDTYSFANESWNGTIAPGQTVTFGFQATGDSSAAMTNITVNGVAVGGDSGSGNSDTGSGDDGSNTGGEDTGTGTDDGSNTGGDNGTGTDNGSGTGTDDGSENPDTSAALVVTVSSDWGSGFTASAALTNTTGQALDNWTVSFDWPYTISSIWDAQIVSHTGNTYTVSSLSWNGALAAGASVSFGFNGSPGSVSSQPTNVTLNGVSVSDGSGAGGDTGAGTDDGSGNSDTGTDDGNTGGDTGSGDTGTGTDDGSNTGGTDTGSGDNGTGGDTGNTGGGSSTTNTGRVVAYFPSWGIYARGYEVADIPAENLTHIVHAFARISTSGTIEVIDTWADLEKTFGDDTWDQTLRGNFNQYQELKAQYPHLKVMIAVGGWYDSGRFSDVAASAAARAKFAQSVVDFVVKYDFDGIDLDWEYPVVATDANTNVRPEDGANYALLAQALRQALDAQGQIDGKHYDISAAVPAGYDKYDLIDLSALSAQLDWFNLMTYDFHGRWDKTRTGHNAPLYANSADPMPEYNAASAVQGYLDAGVPASKINLGIPLYGYVWTGVPSANNGLYQSATGLGAGTVETGIIDYRTIVEQMAADPANNAERWDSQSEVSYIYNAATGTFTSYDSPATVTNKLDFVEAMGLGGVMFWELSNDVRDSDSDASILKLVGERYAESIGAN
ncbi:MAG: glycosyl hydrolase family 18 protein [Verrucomicrobiota bacterium JB024]|nr:glycosyl hydrolase family 18 protein [Verrucomicrobiota bacterium JB024]